MKRSINFDGATIALIFTAALTIAFVVFAVIYTFTEQGKCEEKGYTYVRGTCYKVLIPE